MLFICYPKCSTCQKARKYLTERQINFTERNIKEERPTAEELRKWIAVSGLPVRKFFNTSGLLYKEMNLKEKLSQMTEEEQIELLASDGMLVKRPIVVTEKESLVGFKEAEWEKTLL